MSLFGRNMKTINRDGCGVLFEVQLLADLDAMLKQSHRYLDVSKVTTALVE